MGFLSEREICAASKHVRRIYAYKYHNNTRTIIHIGKNRNSKKKNRNFKRVELSNDTEIKYRKTDCSGDSGGPLWKWMGKSNPMAKVSNLPFF